MLPAAECSIRVVCIKINAIVLYSAIHQMDFISALVNINLLTEHSPKYQPFWLQPYTIH